MAGERQGWPDARRMAEEALRYSLRLSGIEPPLACPTCKASLEATRMGGRLAFICAGACGKTDGRTALQHLRSVGAPVLPGFDGL